MSVLLIVQCAQLCQTADNLLSGTTVHIAQYQNSTDSLPYYSLQTITQLSNRRDEAVTCISHINSVVLYPFANLSTYF